MTRRLARAVLLALAWGVAVLAALGLVARFRAVPGPRVGLSLPLQEAGHLDGASLIVIAISTLAVFGLLALLIRTPRDRILTDAAARSMLVLAWSLTIQAISLQLTRQASLGLDWAGAFRSPTPWIFATSAYLATAAAGVASSDRWMRPRPAERLVEGSATQERSMSIRA